MGNEFGRSVAFHLILPLWKYPCIQFVMDNTCCGTLCRETSCSDGIIASTGMTYLVVVNHLSMSFFISKDSLEVTVSVPASYQPVAVTFLINHSIWPIRAWWRFDKSKFQPEQGLIAPPGLDFGCKEWLQIARLWAEVISTICELLVVNLTHTQIWAKIAATKSVYLYMWYILSKR